MYMHVHEHVLSCRLVQQALEQLRLKFVFRACTNIEATARVLDGELVLQMKTQRLSHG